jgi:hypothetical protein
MPTSAKLWPKKMAYTTSIIFFINNHIRHPSQQQHLDKVFIITIAHQIYWASHKVTIHKVKAHTCIAGNKIAYALANEGAHKDKATTTPRIDIAHTTKPFATSTHSSTKKH